MNASGESNGVVAGESAKQDDFDRIVAAIDAAPNVERLLHLKVVRLGDELLVAAKVALAPDCSLAEAADGIQAVRESIRDAAPLARHVYIEPDVHRPSSDPAPPTDVFVLKSAD